jgi:hypothetical protein
MPLFVAASFCIFIVACGVQARDVWSLVLLHPLGRTLVSIALRHRVAAKISISIMALPIRTLQTSRVLLDDEAAWAGVGAT